MPDEALLLLLLNLEIEFGNDLEIARANYLASSSSVPGAPSLDELIAEGWFRVVWGRLSASRELSSAVRKASGTVAQPLSTLMATRHERKYRVTRTALNDADATAAAIEAAEVEPGTVGCRSPEWVAARLWDRTVAGQEDDALALRVWVDRWELLGYPSLIPGQAWDDQAADQFIDAALAILRSEPSLEDWTALRARYIRQMASANQQPAISFETYVPQVPVTFVDRSLWFDNPALYRTVMENMLADGDLSGLVRLLLAEIAAEEHALAPHKLAGSIFGLATDRPEVFLTIIFQVRYHPVLLADLLLFPQTSAVACLIIAQWNSTTGAWDRELRERDDQATKTIAFADAVSVMGDFLEKGEIDPREPAALLNWFHTHAKPGFADDQEDSEPMLAALRSEFARNSPATLRAMVEGLTTSTPGVGLGTSEFAAALDIISQGDLAADLDATPIVSAYLESVRQGAHQLSAHRISVRSATALFQLGMRLSPEGRQEFLYPLDIRAALATGSDENPFTLADTIARSMRAHIRILSRAIMGIDEAALDELVRALAHIIRSADLGDEGAARIEPFSPRFEGGGFGEPLDRPIAADLGAALRALVGEQRDRLLAALLDTREPMMLAQLLEFAPRDTRSAIERRVADLTPENADGVRSLTEAQARIDVLLSTGLGDAAASFMEAEQGLQTLGSVPGRETRRLRDGLRLHLLRQEWSAIENTQMPENLPASERAAVEETIAFYKALAALSNPVVRKDQAEQMFAQLHKRHSHVAAYAINLLAARINLLLGEDVFGLLTGTAQARGRTVLVEAEQMIIRARTLTPSESEIFNCNTATLLLAVGQPQKAYERLLALRPVQLAGSIAAYSAVALSRIGRVPEALVTLDQTEKRFGDTAVLRAARAHIRSGKPYAAAAPFLLEDDPAPRVKAALWDLSRMDPIQQAEILHPAPDPFQMFITDQVRSAAASVTGLVPMMRGVEIDSCEDDLSAIIRELLVSRFAFLGWSVPDQSKGGYTARGNPGERDLLVQKDSSILAAIEAVVCGTPIAYQNLTQHFQKLFAYASCRLLIHLTYAYIDNPNAIFEYLKQTARNDAPDGFEYRGHQEITQHGTKPRGIVARYRAEDDEVRVVFLVLDMGQHRQRQAAVTAKDYRRKETKG